MFKVLKFNRSSTMYLKEGCSLLLKIQKPLMPFVLNSSPIINPRDPNKQHLLRESDVLKRLKKDRNLASALEFFSAIANSNAFKHTASTYKVMIERLGRECEMDVVQYILQQMKMDGISCCEDLFVCIINSYKRVGSAEQALKMFYRIGEFGCKPTVKIYNHLLDALLSENRFQIINPLYTNMKKDGLIPNVFTYNILLKALCKNDRVDAAHKLFVEMSSKGCPPDVVSYTTMVSSLCKAGKIDDARELAGTFKPSVPVYNALIDGMCKEGRIEVAIKLLGEMMDNGVDPNVVSYSSIINSLCNSGNVELAFALLARMFLRGCDANIHTFTPLIKGCFMRGKLYEALDLWKLALN